MGYIEDCKITIIPPEPTQEEIDFCKLLNDEINNLLHLNITFVIDFKEK